MDVTGCLVTIDSTQHERWKWFLLSYHRPLVLMTDGITLREDIDTYFTKRFTLAMTPQIAAEMTV